MFQKQVTVITFPSFARADGSDAQETSELISLLLLEANMAGLSGITLWAESKVFLAEGCCLS